MKHPERIHTERRQRTSSKFPLAGWALVYAIVFLMLATLVYFIRRNP